MMEGLAWAKRGIKRDVVAGELAGDAQKHEADRVYMRQTGFIRAHECWHCLGITKRIRDQQICPSSCINTYCYLLSYGARFFS